MMHSLHLLVEEMQEHAVCTAQDQVRMTISHRSSIDAQTQQYKRVNFQPQHEAIGQQLDPLALLQ